MLRTGVDGHVSSWHPENGESHRHDLGGSKLGKLKLSGSAEAATAIESIEGWGTESGFCSIEVQQ